MDYPKDIIEIIGKRISVRSYDKRAVEPEKLSAFEAFLQSAAANPFGADVRLEMVNPGNQRLGTYGFIKGAQLFFGGCVKKGSYDIEGFGYAFEKAVLFATAQGLGTCWLGGTFKRGAVTAMLKPEGEYLPAISPIGYAAEKKSLTEKMVAAGAGARTRKKFAELFFDNNFCTPLVIEDGALKACLEMVRIGPSASNRQPWRVVRQAQALHFYMMRDKRYAGNTLYGFCMQKLDLGIAACHFEMAARQLGLPGSILIDDPDILTEDQKGPGLVYSFSWR